MRKLIIFIFVFANTNAFAYETAVHKEITRAALTKTNINNALQRIGIDTYTPLSLNNKVFFGTDWILEGSVREDDIPNSKNHFYDPISGKGLSNYYGNNGTDALEVAPAWALDDLSNEYSYPNVKQYLYQAMTSKTTHDRNLYSAKFLRGVGQIVHLVEDMAQPEHVRNDIHFSIPICPDTICFDYSRYERYTLEHLSISKKPGFHLKSIYFQNIYDLSDNRPPVSFDYASAYWGGKYEDGHLPDGQSQSIGKGLALFTNKNFVSQSRNLDSNLFDSPKLGVHTFDSSEDSVSLMDIVSGETFFNIKIQYIGYDYTDPITGQADKNNYLSAKSVFDFISKEYVGKDVYTLTDKNFDSEAKALIPRAIIFAAGLINFIVRGNISASNAVINSDYNSVILNVSNDSNQTSATIGSGQFILTAKYDVNGTETYSISDPVQFTQTILPEHTDPSQISFYFTNENTIPTNAENVTYHLVFRGNIGYDSNGIAFGTVNGTKASDGFVVKSPSFVNGLPGNNLIYQSDGIWKLSQFDTYLAGDIDWKGQYIGGKPTKILSWDGHNRYFGVGNSPYIYEDGHIQSVAPGQLLGTAINKDANDKEWIIAITTKSKVLYVYKRPNTRSESSDLYDKENAPNGWRLLGTANYPTESTNYIRNWLFNGDGNEAQSMIEMNDGSMSRMKISINNDLISFLIIENTTNTSTSVWSTSSTGTVTCEKMKASDGTTYYSPKDSSGSSYSQSTEYGKFPVAVDYINNQPILGYFKVEASSSSSTYNSYTSGSGSIINKEDNSNYRIDFEMGNTSVNLDYENTNVTGNGTFPDSSPGTITVNKDYTFNYGELDYVDLRGYAAISDINIFHIINNISDTTDTIASIAITSDIGKNVKLNATTLGSINVYNDILHSEGTVNDDNYGYPITRGSSPVCKPDGGYTDDYSNSGTTVYTIPVQEYVLGTSKGNAALAIDRQNNILTSIYYLDNNNVARYYNLLSSGDLASVTGSPNDSYFIYSITPK